MLKCNICGCEFPAINEKRYIAKDNGMSGLAVAFGSHQEEKLYDAFDCPMCGCQLLVQERKRNYTPVNDSDEEDANDAES